MRKHWFNVFQEARLKTVLIVVDACYCPGCKCDPHRASYWHAQRNLLVADVPFMTLPTPFGHTHPDRCTCQDTVTTLWPLTRQRQMACHSDLVVVAVAPYFAAAEPGHLRKNVADPGHCKCLVH